MGSVSWRFPINCFRDFEMIFTTKNLKKITPKPSPNHEKFDAKNMLIFYIEFFAFWYQIWRVWASKMVARFALWAPLGLHGSLFGHPFDSLGSVLAHLGANYWESGAPRPSLGSVLEPRDPIWRFRKWTKLIWKWIYLFWQWFDSKTKLLRF